MIRALLYALALSLLASVVLYALWQHDAGENARNKTKAAHEQIAHMQAEAKARDAVAAWLAALRDRLPKAGRKVSDAVHQEPSRCSVSPAVGNSLRESIGQGNAARRGADSLP